MVVVNNQHEVEFEKYKELEIKLHETETRLNDYIEENNKLSRTLESVQLELKDSIAQNVEILELKNVLEVTRLNELVESESCHIEENKKLPRTLESVQLELKDSIAQIFEMSESISQLKEMLVKSEVEIRQRKELETELFVTETRFDKSVKRKDEENLEIKGKYVNVESGLKEMHARYSQLLLFAAEVEGERQKLMMTLKNVRSSRNLLRLNRSSMAAIEDRPL
ncbi:hypothetical protein L2E82_22483 [Cichorium intybus]|uniref:Uncharacterized protein n=1 Tax=Cichorium intybus TaxID=13427 RepID=A0ACB9DXW9_CICIN|nr:hypothetical protein L2E82_22483 [Cichorium intybus]